MKKKYLLPAVLLSLPLLAHAQTTAYQWHTPQDGDLNDAVNWSPEQSPGANGNLFFRTDGDYKVGLSSDLSANLLQVEGGAGTVTFALGSHSLILNSIFLVNQDTVVESGHIQGLVQIGLKNSNKTLTLQGAGTTWTSQSGAYVGRSDTAAGNNNALFIGSGSSMQIDGSMIVGNNNNTATASNGNKLTVSGIGSKLTTGDMLVGNLVSNAVGAESKNNALVVTDGAKAQFASLTVGRRANGVTRNTGSGNTATVGGGAEASEIAVNGYVTIGNASGGNVLRVSAKGVVDASKGTTTLNNGAGNALVIDGGRYLGTGQTTVVYGVAAINMENNGYFEAKVLDLKGVFKSKGSGAVNVETLTLSETSDITISLLSGTEYTKFTVSGTTQPLEFKGKLTVSFGAGYQAAAGDHYQLFAFQSSTSEFVTLNLPTLGAGLEWDTSTFYQTGVLQVIPEPSTRRLGLAAGAALLLVGLVQRRGRKATNIAR